MDIPEHIKKRMTPCDYEKLEKCLRENNRDITKCEKEVLEFQTACAK